MAGGGYAIGRTFRWILLSAVPSSLMLGLTTYLSTEIAVLPLVWVIPLALYLLTFVVTFAQRRSFLQAGLWIRLMPLVVLPLAVAVVAQLHRPAWVVIGLHVFAFVTMAMVCHGELARDRPHPAFLTHFYLWIAVGGSSVDCSMR